LTRSLLISLASLLPMMGQILPLSAGEPPRLVLQITVDQLRGDLPVRYMDRMGEGGFRYLYQQGTVYRDAHHAHSNTETIVGHATLATGANPSAHGMVANVWLDRTSGELVYNIEDPRFEILSADAGVDRQSEIDPTQRVARSDGRSPAALLVSTFSDELALRYGEDSKIFGVSIKDRGAVAMAGHAGKAFWFSKKTGDFITSSYYYEHYPDWVSEWNARRLPFEYAGKSWELLRERSSYFFAEADDQPYETDFPGYGRTFPHPFGPSDSRYFLTLLTLSPAGDELTLDFAKSLIAAEKLGQDDTPDYLSVSFSSTDYVGHLFGPSSLEAEDNLLRLDRTLADLFRFVDRQVGLDKTLIVLSSDHGSPEIPGRLREIGIEADYFNPKTAENLPGIDALKNRFGIEAELIKTYFHPYVYLDREEIQKHGLDLRTVETAVAGELEQLEGIALAVSSSALRDGRIPMTPLTESILRNYSPKRSGDIYIVFEPHWFINDFDGLEVASAHGSPWRYDTFVPLVFAGPGVPSREIFQRVYTVDVAPTLAALCGVKPPSGSVGEVLVAVVEKEIKGD
jgi:predicted AlkP superfamily pyrophosphatase or phosphodiesterase